MAASCFLLGLFGVQYSYPGGGALGYTGGPHLSYVFRRRRGLF